MDHKLKYNFDEMLNRKNTACYKYDGRKDYFGTEDVLPMWVADMDFKTPRVIIDAIKKRLQHEILGYSFRPDSYYESIIKWMKRRHDWEIKKEWIGFSPGIVSALNVAVLAFTDPGDKIIVQPPVYFPFFSAVKKNDRGLVLNPLILKEGRYFMDYDDLEGKIDRKVKMIILCNPHNPTGNVWSEKELGKLIDICKKYDIVILSDEIHSDIIYSGHKHMPAASPVLRDLAPQGWDRIMTLMSPSKAFNLAGLSTSEVITSNEKLMDNFTKIIDRLHIGSGNIFGAIALEAAYNEGEEWLEELKNYLEGNIDLLSDFLHKKIPQVKLIVPEATFMAWLDFRKLGTSNDRLKKFVIEEAGLGLSDGPIFGKEGSGFQRMNIGCPRKVLIKALNRLEKAVKKVEIRKGE
jgi:cystathionine beta-lyase